MSARRHDRTRASKRASKRFALIGLAVILSLLGLAASEALASVKVVKSPGVLTPGGAARLDLAVTKASSCRLTFAGPRGAKHVSAARIPVRARYVRVTWTVGPRSAPGKWKLNVTCGAGKRLQRASSSTRVKTASKN